MSNFDHGQCSEPKSLTQKTTHVYIVVKHYEVNGFREVDSVWYSRKDATKKQRNLQKNEQYTSVTIERKKIRGNQ